MADVNRILEQLLKSGAGAGLAGGVAGGLLASKTGRKLGKKAVELGALAAVGALAWSAWSRYRGGAGAQASLPAPLSPEALAGARAGGFLPAPSAEAEQEALGLLLLRTMIAAARADGRLDEAETERILREVGRSTLTPEERARLLAELAQPADLDTLAAGAAGSPARAAEVYAAALLAIDADTETERAWLAALASRLQLPEELVAELHLRTRIAAQLEEPPARADATLGGRGAG